MHFSWPNPRNLRNMRRFGAEIEQIKVKGTKYEELQPHIMICESGRHEVAKISSQESFVLRDVRPISNTGIPALFQPNLDV